MPTATPRWNLLDPPLIEISYSKITTLIYYFSIFIYWNVAASNRINTVGFKIKKRKKEGRKGKKKERQEETKKETTITHRQGNFLSWRCSTVLLAKGGRSCRFDVVSSCKTSVPCYFYTFSPLNHSDRTRNCLNHRLRCHANEFPGAKLLLLDILTLPLEGRRYRVAR